MGNRFYFLLFVLLIPHLLYSAECSSWPSAKFKAADYDSESMDLAVKDAFHLNNVKDSQASFNNCIFKVKPNLNSKLQTFDYSKDEPKCKSIKLIFEMNLVGCESTTVYSNEKTKEPGIK